MLARSDGRWAQHASTFVFNVDERVLGVDAVVSWSLACRVVLVEEAGWEELPRCI